MRRKAFLIPMLLIISSYAYPQTHCSNCEIFIKDFVNRYIPSLSKIICHGDMSAGFFCEGDAEPQLLNCLPVLVHEQLHHYNKSLNEELISGARKYYFSERVYILQRVPNIFESSLIAPIFPKNLVDSNLRYQSYIIGKNITDQNDPAFKGDSRKNGIYGLLEELSAYYYSVLTAVKEYDYLRTCYPADSSRVWFDYMIKSGTLITSYYEFKLFIAYYLFEAKNNYGQVYSQLVSNNELKELYSRIDESFTQIIKTYWENREKIMNSKQTILIKNSYAFTKENSNDRYLLPDNDLKKLQAHFTPAVVNMLKALHR
ncbi:hypothetical protein [Chitinophaga filiformis]|uniref:DUF3829 domain-containing protein n=1 Tax=Chitinophaga filiformis TaxID=104663 RepID=A0ABY4HYU3_CHIFI|nr:hypothetical protein [Chitinophaga filiformis]UPK68727.1 hypothetical protein MYF79_27580 [Chitinophaga filiformis]